MARIRTNNKYTALVYCVLHGIIIYFVLYLYYVLCIPGMLGRRRMRRQDALLAGEPPERQCYVAHTFSEELSERAA